MEKDGSGKFRNNRNNADRTAKTKPCTNPMSAPASRITMTNKKVKKLDAPPVKLMVTATTLKSTSICVQVSAGVMALDLRNVNKYQRQHAAAAR